MDFPTDGITGRNSNTPFNQIEEYGACENAACNAAAPKAEPKSN
jgi:hypothetical protein